MLSRFEKMPLPCYFIKSGPVGSVHGSTQEIRGGFMARFWDDKEQLINYDFLLSGRINICTAGLHRHFKPWNNCGICTYHWNLYYNPDSPGSGIRTDKADFPLDNDNMLLVPPFTVYNTYSSSPISHFYVHFTCEDLFFKIKHQPFYVPADRVLLKQLPELFEEGQGSLRLSFAVESLIRHALVFIPEDFKVEVKSNAYDSRIDKVIQSCVKERRMVSNADMAKIAGTSVQNFEKLFRKQTGLSPRKFQQIRQMQWAADKLRLTDLSIDEIAEKSGYLNRHNFTRAFKLFFGINPAAYRKKSFN